MEDTIENIAEVLASSTKTGEAEPSSSSTNSNGNVSQTLFPDSPVYEPEEDMEANSEQVDEVSPSIGQYDEALADIKEKHSSLSKRKLSDEPNDCNAKVQKLELAEQDSAVSSQTLDDEVSDITAGAKRNLDDAIPSVSRVRTPMRSSPRRLAKRSNSADLDKPKIPRTPKTRPASVDTTKSRKTPRKGQLNKSKEHKLEEAGTSNSRPSVEFIAEIPPPKVPDTIVEESNSDLNDSQNFHLVLEEDSSDEKTKIPNYSSDPVVVKDRKEILDPGKIEETRSEGFTYSNQNSNLSQPRPKAFIDKKATDQESTDSIGSLNLDSPDHVPSVSSKLISKLSNGNSSTPTEALAENKRGGSDSCDGTPDMVKLNGNKLKRNKNESFKNSNSTTPSTISPLQNGHSLPASTPQVPIFDVHVSHNEDNEFLSLYVVRIDNDLSMDMYKEYQRISKRFTMDGYQADVSASNSTSSVTSGGMISLPNRASFSSTISSISTLSSRTSDGNFLVPQAPRKSVLNPSTSVKGYDALLKKIQDIFSHVRDGNDDTNRSLSDDKVSVAIQTSLSNESSSVNGNASPEEVAKCDKATPKSSLKKSRVKGRRHIAGKTKRALLPTQMEEPEIMHGMNSPEMVPTNGENGKESPMKSPKEEKPLSSLIATPKSVNKLKQKRRPTSPRLLTPVEKPVVKQEYPGYPPDTVVLAKWAANKRYYSGKVQQITEPNKYLIKFDDGHTKVLLDDFIIFGDMKTLPLQGQSVYAQVDKNEKNYEPGLVLGVEESGGTVAYKCTTDGDMMVLVTASELYLTEDQARSLKESARARSPMSPVTPRRRHNRELDLDNIIQGPRSARTRDKGNSSAKKRITSPKSPKASTSGVKSNAKSTPVSRKRLASESSEMSESSNSAPPVRLEEVAGVEPEVQRTPRKIDGVKAGPLQLKGAAKQNIGKKNSKLTKFENDEDTVTLMGPIPPSDSKLFAGLHFLLTCTDTPRRSREKSQSHYSSEEDGETASTVAAAEDVTFCSRPFNKERLKEQIEAGGGIVYSHFDDVPKSKYSVCKLIAPRPCLTAKYIQCLAADVRAYTHGWVIARCLGEVAPDEAHVLPAGWSLHATCYRDWVPPSGKRNTTFFKDKLILLCSDQDTFLKFWERVCTLAGANTRVVNEDDLNMSGAIALVTEWDCPHEVQNKANQDNVPLVSTHWVIQCLIEGKVLDPNGHAKFSFAFTEQE